MTTTLHATFRGIVGAMAMSGVRVFAKDAGIVSEEPPRRLTRKRARGLLRSVSRKRSGAVAELVHWAMGGMFGAVFGLLPERLRRRAWSGPAFGFGVWLMFDALIAPLLGLSREWPKGRERSVFVVDHLLFGLILNEMRRRPRE
jgi:hypothetical protein